MSPRIFGSAIAETPTYLSPEQIAELRDHPVSIAMQGLVPLMIAELRQKGGPDDADLARARSFVPDLVGPGSEALVFPGDSGGGKGLGGLTSKTAFAVAVLSFCPGGVRFCGVRYQARPGEWEAGASAGIDPS